MTSSPEQEIPQEVIDKVFDFSLGDNGCIGIMDIGDPYYRELRREIVAGMLAAVLPDLQRPLLEEIKRLREDRLQAIYNVGAKAQQFEAERNARPDLTDEEKYALIALSRERERRNAEYRGDLRGPDIVIESARAKLERSLDAAG